MPLADGGDVWKEAVDPKSGRKYWFNKETKVSTWTNPFQAESPAHAKGKEQREKQQKQQQKHPSGQHQIFNAGEIKEAVQSIVHSEMRSLESTLHEFEMRVLARLDSLEKVVQNSLLKASAKLDTAESDNLSRPSPHISSRSLGRPRKSLSKHLEKYPQFHNRTGSMVSLKEDSTVEAPLAQKRKSIVELTNSGGVGKVSRKLTASSRKSIEDAAVAVESIRRRISRTMSVSGTEAPHASPRATTRKLGTSANTARKVDA